MTGLARAFSPRWRGRPPADVEVRLPHRRTAWTRCDRASTEGSALTDLDDGWLVIALHGLGASERQLRTLVPLDLPGLVLAPRAPHPRGREGWSWTDPATATDAAALTAAVDDVGAFVDWAVAQVGVVPRRTVVLGYSQGAAVAAAFGVLRPDAADAVVCTTAALPVGLAALRGGGPRRALVTRGLRDQLVDEAALAALRSRWRAAGTVVTTLDYDVPHVVTPRMASDVSVWIMEEVPDR